MKPILVIGTSAPRRRAMAAHHLSTEYELVFCSPDIDEKSIRSSNAFELTSLISSAKMDAIVASIHADAELSTQIAQRPGSMALSFDQVVVWQDEIREKPESEEENLRFLASYSNSSLDTVQTTVLHSFSTGKRWSAPNTTTTYYRDIPLEVVQKVVKKQVSRHAAGGFVVEDEDMMAFMIRIDPGTSEEVQGFSIGTIRKLIAMNVDESG